MRKHFSRAPWEREVGLVPYGGPDGLVRQFEEEEDDFVPIVDQIQLKRWEKFLDYESMLPNMRQWKFDTDDQGALKIEFSNKGKYLAIASTMASSKTVVKIVDVEKGGQAVLILRGHHDLIHDINWSQNDKYLVTASADGSAKVWDLNNIKKD